jgi:transposase
MSSHYLLTAQEIANLEVAHRQTKDKRYADRLKTVYLLGKGWSVTQVAEALMMDRETVRNHYKRYRKGGLPALQKFEAGGSESFLNELEKQALDQHLNKNLYLTAKEIAHYIEQTWGVSYSESGITQLLYRMGYVYKKPKLVPGKADAGKQRAFVQCYEALKADKAPEDPIYFMDATHPHHNPVAGYGWIKRGQDCEIRTHTGRQRLNINGAINTVSLQAIVRYDDTINAQSTIQLFQQIEAHHPTAACIHIICDNARYYRSQLIRDYLNNSKIKLVFLPPYAPNLNLIERYWKFFKKKILYGRYYETFSLFKSTCEAFFTASDHYKAELRTLLTDNFQIIGST